MADRHQPHQVQVQRPHDRPKTGGGGPSIGKVLAVMTMLPLGGTLLAFSGMTLFATLIGLAIATPVFIIFSPVIVPAALVIGLAVFTFLTSGLFGLTGLSSLSRFFTYLRQVTMTLPGSLDLAKQRMQDVAGQVGQKTKDLGQKTQETTR